MILFEAFDTSRTEVSSPYKTVDSLKLKQMKIFDLNNSRTESHSTSGGR